MQAERQRAQEQVKAWLPVATIVLLGAALRFWSLGSLALVGDEGYYWLWSRHLDWSYYDNPGATAWMIRLSTLIGGQSELGIRWLNALLGVIDVALIYGLGRELFCARAGSISAAFMAVAAPYIITSRFVYTDGITFFLFLLNMLLLLPVLVNGDVPVPWQRWLLIGLNWLLLLQTKLSMYPYWVAIAVGIALWRRDLLHSPQLWWTAAGASLGLLPFWLWNANHGWVGLKWILRQSTQGAILASSEMAAIYHAVIYLTPPVVLLCAFGLALGRKGAGRWLAWIAVLLLLPVLASPADNPRNLLQGSIPLFSLAGGFFATSQGFLRWKRPVLISLLGATLLYGLGTVLSVTDWSAWPGNSVALELRRDAAGRRDLGELLRSEAQPVVTVDYSLAGQLTFYAGRPIYSTWGQYRIWGIPDLTNATIVSLDYVPAELVHEQLQAAYAEVEGPRAREIGEYGISGRAHIWRARGLEVSGEQLLQSIDFLTLYQASRKTAAP
jgi:hypothetical protein